MEEIKDFDAFYTSRLQPFFSDLKLQSNDAAKWSTAGIASVILAVFCFIMHDTFVAVLLIILLIVSIYKYTEKKDLFVNNYKETIINEIVKYLNPGMIYKPYGYMSSKDYKRSGLFRHRYDYYGGDDFIKGTYKDIRFSASELEIEYDSSPSNRMSIFKGLFFAASINSGLAGGTYIWPREDEQLANSIMDEGYRLIPLPRVYHMKMNNVIFENHFSVYSTNPGEAKIIIDQEMMERVIKFKQQIKRNIRFSVVAGICYVAISIDEELLEPSISGPDNKEDIKGYFFSILLIFSIINQLNLSRLK